MHSRPLTRATQFHAKVIPEDTFTLWLRVATEEFVPVLFVTFPAPHHGRVSQPEGLESMYP